MTELSNPSVSRCCPYLGDCSAHTYNVGYAGNHALIVFIIFNIIGILSNLVMLIYSFFFKKSEHTNINRLFLSVSVIELLISITWIINISVFKDTAEMEAKCEYCKVYACFPTFLYITLWLLLIETMRQLKKIIASALIVNNSKAFLKNLLICILFAFAFTVSAYFLNLTGTSVSHIYIYIYIFIHICTHYSQ